MPDVYKIGVEIALAGTIVQGLETVAAKLLGINKISKDVEGGFGRWKLAIEGVAGVFASGAILGALSKIADKGAELLNQQNQLLRLNVSQADILRLTSKYWTDVAAKVPTSTVAEYLQTVKELRAVMGDLGGAEGFAPQALKVDALLSNTSGETLTGTLYKLLRSGELKGISTDPAKLEDLVTQAYSYVAAFGGKLTPQMIQSLAVRGGTAWMNADLKKSFGPMAVLAAEMGGAGGSSSSPGVVLYQLQQLMMGANTMSKQQTQVMQTLGLIDMSKTTPTGFGGGSFQLLPGAIKGSAEYVGNVPGWARDVVWPALVAASTKNGVLDDALLQNYLAKIAPTTNKAKAIELFGNPEFLKQQIKDLGLAKQAWGIDPAYQSFISANPLGVEAAYNQQYEAALQAMGAPLMKIKIPILQALTAMFTAIGGFADAHPEALVVIGKGMLALSAGLAALGTAAIIGAALAVTGPVGAAIIGIAAAIAALAALNWGAVGAGLHAIASDFSWFIGAIEGLAARVGDVLSHLGLGASTHAGSLNLAPSGALNLSPMHPSGLGPNSPNYPRQNLSQAIMPMHIKTAVYLDGRVIGETTSSELARLSTFPRQAAYGDPYAGWVSPDYNSASG